MKYVVLRVGLAVAVFGLAGGGGQAGIIMNVPVVTTVGPGGATVDAVTQVPNNFDSPGSPNGAFLGYTLNGLSAPLDLNIQAFNSGGSTEYRLDSSLVNRTGTEITSIQFELGTGTGLNFVRFAASSPLNFDTADRLPLPTASNFSTINQQPEVLSYSGGSIGAPAAGFFSFSVVIPDFGSSPFNFTLRATPNTVPEPATFVGAAVAGLFGLAYAWRRTRAA